MLFRLRPLARRGQGLLLKRPLAARLHTGIVWAARPDAPPGKEYVYTEAEVAQQEQAGRIWNEALLEPRETETSWREFDTRIVGLEVVPNAREVYIF